MTENNYIDKSAGTEDVIDFGLTVGLFGTCGKSTWRKKFMELYDLSGIPYFNPQVEDWKPELAEIEAMHLAKDGIILFPVTSETYGTGSLSETGFSIVNAIRSSSERYVVLMIDEDLDEDLTDEVARNESLRARKLLRAHLKELDLPNVLSVNNFQEMYEASVKLYAAVVMKRMATIQDFMSEFPKTGRW